MSLIARVVVGGLLVLESLVMTILGVFTVLIGGLVGALAFLVGAGGATDEKVAEGIAVMAISIASPFVVAVVLAIGGVFLLLRRQKRVIITAGILAIAAQIAFHRLSAEGLHPAELVVSAVHLATIAVAFAFVPAPATNAAST